MLAEHWFIKFNRLRLDSAHRLEVIESSYHGYHRILLC